MTIASILGKLKLLNKESSLLYSQLKIKRSQLKFRCGCGRLHRIKDCDLIQTHWYKSPHGCTGGDYWNSGEVQIICPVTDNKNRVLFKSVYQIPYELRDHFAYSAEQQFLRIYKNLFKSVIDDYDTDKRGWWNCYYFDENHRKFGISIPLTLPEGADSNHGYF